MSEENAGTPTRSRAQLAEAGFNFVPFPTTAEGKAYTVEIPQAESWEVYFGLWRELGHNPDEVLTDILNAANKQGGSQGAKTPVRDAVKTGDEDAIAAAIEQHQESAETYVLGAPRAGRRTTHETGLTTKQRESLGSAVARKSIEKGGAPTQAEIESIYEELGLPH